MAKQLFENNAAGTLASTTAGFLPNGGTSLTLTTGHGNYFPNPTGGDWFLITLYEIDTALEVNYEVVKCTARTTDTLTIERDVEGVVGVSGGRSYPTVGGRTVHVELRFTQMAAEQFLQNGDISGATEKTTPVDADTVPLTDSAASSALKKLSWSNIKATLKTYFDTLYALAAHTHTGVYEPADSNLLKTGNIGSSVQGYDADLAWLAANLTTAGRNILDDTDNTAQRTTLGLGDSATKNVGTGASDVAAGNHGHTGYGFPTVSVTSSTSFTASVNMHYVLTGTATTVTLPPSPAAGDMVWITVANGLTTNVVARNGNQIMGLNEDMTIDATYSTVMLRWTDSTYDWRII